MKNEHIGIGIGVLGVGGVIALYLWNKKQNVPIIPKEPIIPSLPEEPFFTWFAILMSKRFSESPYFRNVEARTLPDYTKVPPSAIGSNSTLMAMSFIDSTKSGWLCEKITSLPITFIPKTDTFYIDEYQGLYYYYNNAWYVGWYSAEWFNL